MKEAWEKYVDKKEIAKSKFLMWLTVIVGIIGIIIHVSMLLGLLIVGLTTTLQMGSLYLIVVLVFFCKGLMVQNNALMDGLDKAVSKMNEMEAPKQ